MQPTKPKRRSGPPKGQGGRPKGSLNKITVTAREAALVYAPDILREMARIALEGKTETVRILAGKEILDRAYGKSPQPISGDDGSGPVKITVHWQE